MSANIPRYSSEDVHRMMEERFRRTMEQRSGQPFTRENARDLRALLHAAAAAEADISSDVVLRLWSLCDRCPE